MTVGGRSHRCSHCSLFIERSYASGYPAISIKKDCMQLLLSSVITILNSVKRKYPNRTPMLKSLVQPWSSLLAELSYQNFHPNIVQEIYNHKYYFPGEFMQSPRTPFVFTDQSPHSLSFQGLLSSSYSLLLLNHFPLPAAVPFYMSCKLWTKFKFSIYPRSYGFDAATTW